VSRIAQCPQCQQSFQAATGRINRAASIGAPLYCGRACAGMARRLANPPTEAERKAAKSAYDRKYRARHAEKRKAQKADHYRRTRDREKERVARKSRMPQHVEYCRRPEYREWKSDYDRRHRARKVFGEFADAALLLQDVEREIDSQATPYERRIMNGTLNKAQMRRRAL